MQLNDTIAAIATPRGSGGIAIVRLSGSDAEAVAEKITKPKNKKRVSELESHKLTLSRIYTQDGKTLIDEALVAVMRAPKSYTGENVVEINCHGGFLAAEKILTALLYCGARLAEPGEFTRRAFVNGKTDLSRAEAIMDLMEATSEIGLHNAALTADGAISDSVNLLREKTLGIASHISACVDYPDEVDMPNEDELCRQISEIKSELDIMIDGFDTGRLMRDGVRTVIAGRPNAGKSSLLNALLKCERAIVTDIPGTTRDTIEEIINIGGTSIRLIDTAGIHKGSDEVEIIGIQKSREAVESADLCLFVIDLSQELSGEDMEISELVKGRKTVVIFNKSDKEQVLNPEEALNRLSLSKCPWVKTSMPKNEVPTGTDRLLGKIQDAVSLGNIKGDRVYLANERQRDSLIKSRDALNRATDSIKAGMPCDLIFVDLEDALFAFGEVTGETVSEEIVDNVFKRFCVGK